MGVLWRDRQPGRTIQGEVAGGLQLLCRGLESAAHFDAILLGSPDWDRRRLSSVKWPSSEWANSSALASRMLNSRRIGTTIGTIDTLVLFLLVVCYLIRKLISGLPSREPQRGTASNRLRVELRSEFLARLLLPACFVSFQSGID